MVCTAVTNSSLGPGLPSQRHHNLAMSLVEQGLFRVERDFKGLVYHPTLKAYDLFDMIRAK